jgi:hypothetical protein
MSDVQEKEYVPLYKDLDIKWHPASHPTEGNEVVGLYFLRNEEGYAVRCYQSDGKIWSFPENLEDWLLEQDDRIFFTDGIDRELDSVVKWLGEDYCQKLIDGYDVSVSGVLIGYHGCLTTRIAGGKSLRRIWQLKPFYPSYMTPEYDDCYGVQARGQRLVKLFGDLGLPMSFTSCGSVLASMAPLPFDSAPKDVSELAYNCYHGGWIESFKLGHFSKAYDYDLASAYPSEIAHLYSCSTKCGSWYECNSFIQEALYGFAYCHITLDVTLPFSPIMVRLRAYMSHSGSQAVRVIRNPVGSWNGWLTKDEIEFIVRNWLGNVEVIYGKWFIPHKYEQPFLPLVSGLNQMRQFGKSIGDKLVNYVGKIIPASIQGKMMQSTVINGKRIAGSAFNPVYAATLTARVRLRDAALALDEYDKVLGVVVDGILAREPMCIDRRWKLEYHGDCVIANHGDYDIEGRDTALPLRKVLSDNSSERNYPLRAARYISLTEALEGSCFAEAGRRRPESYTWVRKVGKRRWDKLPHICGDLLENQYDSYPLLVNERAGALMETDNRWQLKDDKEREDIAEEE